MELGRGWGALKNPGYEIHKIGVVETGFIMTLPSLNGVF
jgi:hypothetical protein